MSSLGGLDNEGEGGSQSSKTCSRSWVMKSELFSRVEGVYGEVERDYERAGRGRWR